MEINNILQQLKWPLLFSSLLALLLTQLSCNKYLDAKPNKALVTPNTIQDLQGLLDYFPYMDNQCSDEGEVASDNYYMTDNQYAALAADRERNAYLWKSDIWTGWSPTDWQNEYTIVYNANIVLNNIQNIIRNSTNAAAWDNCKGSALMFRGKAFYEIAQIWTKAYDSTTANTDLGIPLRLTSDFNAKSIRSNVATTYAQIISDLKASIPLLPNMPVFPYRPSKCAAYGELARTYLAMRDYYDAGLYADSCLQINNKLLDYNTLDPNSFFSFTSVRFSNPEDIMHTICVDANGQILPWSANIDTSLYRSYDTNDLRKTIFFTKNSDGTFFYKGTYEGAGSALNYNGIATDEMYLIRAECYSRNGNIQSAMNDLNTLLAKRWKTGTFIPFNANNATDALNTILTERRKELVFRTLRFTDLKRLNKEGANITLKRIINGQIYTLRPNDPRYALPIPEDVIQISGMQQNPQN